MIEFAIIAAGEGSRLKEDGFSLPKPLLPLAGTPMIERLIHIFANQGAPRVHVLVNSQSPQLLEFLEGNVWPVPVVCHVKDTDSSLHSLYTLATLNPDWEACCVTTTDTVFSEPDFARYVKGFEANQEADAYMGLTAFIDDESPLYADVDATQRVVAYADHFEPHFKYVSAGIYGLRRQALDRIKKCVDQGYSRMRNYQRYLLEENLWVQGHLLGKVVDVDHLKDREAAEVFLSEITIS